MEFTAKQIAEFIQGTIVGDENAKVHTFAKIEEGVPGAISFLSNPKYIHYIYDTQASIVLVNRDFEPEHPVSPTLIRVDNAYESLAKLLALYESMKPKRTGIDPLAYVAPTAKIGKDVYLAPFSAVGDHAEIGDGTELHPHATVGSGAKVGKNCILYANTTVYHDCRVGNNCILHAGSVIGADGFGFMPNAQGGFDKIPQLGNVVIEDDVEIGANTCIDRAKTDSTVIRRGVKLDNLIQIGHNVQIGENTVSSAQTGIAGTSKVGRNCFLAGQVGIADHVTIGDRVKIGSQSGVDKDVPDGEVRMGTPALPGIKFHRANAVFRNLPELQQRLSALEKAVNQLIEK